MKRMTISKDDISEVYVEGIKIYLKLKDKRKKHIVTAYVLNKCFIKRRKFNGNILKDHNAKGFN